MRILLVSPFFPPHRAVSSLRTYSFAQSWSAAGHDVTVLTTCKRDDQSGLNLDMAGFRVVELPHAVPKLLERLRSGERSTRNQSISADSAPLSIAGRLFRPLRWLKDRTGVFGGVRQPDLTDFWIRPATQWALHQGRWDAVVSSFGPPAAISVGSFLRRRGRCRIWAVEFRDLWLDNDPYGGLFPFSLAERRRERSALASADIVVTISPPLANRLRQKSGRPVEVIYNGYDAASFANLPAEPAFPNDRRIRLVHTGTVYLARQDPTPLLRVLSRLSGVTLVVAGSQSELWRTQAQRAGAITAVEVGGQVSRVDSLRMQRDASALILFGWGKTPNGVLPGKCFEYLKSPAPIWVIGGHTRSAAVEMIQRAGRGIHLPNEATIERAIATLVSGENRELNANLSFIAELERGRQAAQFLALLQDSIAKRP